MDRERRRRKSHGSLVRSLGIYHVASGTRQDTHLCFIGLPKTNLHLTNLAEDATPAPVSHHHWCVSPSCVVWQEVNWRLPPSRAREGHLLNNEAFDSLSLYLKRYCNSKNLFSNSLHKETYSALAVRQNPDLLPFGVKAIILSFCAHNIGVPTTPLSLILI